MAEIENEKIEETTEEPEIIERKNPFCVISKESDENGWHDLQTNGAWTRNPYGEAFAVVPDNLVEDIMETYGFCDLELNEDGTEVVSFTKRAIPIIPEPDPEPTPDERIAALEEENEFLKETQAEQDEMILENNFNILVLMEGIADIV